MKVAAVAMLCEDARVFKAMMMSGTPCPFKGKIGKKAKNLWNKYPELRPDFENYQDDLDTLIDAGKLNSDGTVIVVKSSTRNFPKLPGVSNRIGAGT
jgi:Holliday junction resolvase RusA-like endonuclease